MSALIFVALAVGWAAYLIPQALRRQDEGGVALSDYPAYAEHADRARVLPRTSALTREAMAVRASTTAPATPSPVARRRARAAARRSARRRMVVLVLLLAVTATVVALSVLGHVATGWVVLPGFVVVCWLIVCRSAARASAARVPASPPLVRPSTPTEDVEAVVAPSLAQAAVETVPGVRPEAEVAELVAEAARATGNDVATAAGPALWDPVPITLPTYVGKPAARRTVRTIDLTRVPGVTSSGHDADDSALARRAEAEAASRPSAQPTDEASGEHRSAAG